MEPARTFRNSHVLVREGQRKFWHYFVQGVTAAATGAIAGAVIVLAKHSIHDYWTAAIALTTFLILMKWKVPEPNIIGVAGLLGLAIHLRA
jgi:chromate transporter